MGGLGLKPGPDPRREEHVSVVLHVAGTKDTVALQISVDDRLGMKVTGERREGQKTERHDGKRPWCGGGNSLHALSSLTRDIDELDHLELGLDDVQVVVEAGAFAPLGHYGQLRLGGVAHEQQDVDVTRFPAGTTHLRHGGSTCVYSKCITHTLPFDILAQQDTKQQRQ